MSGERWIFGIDQDQLEPFLTQRGFREILNATTEELKQL
jgi:hypothetical protein